MEEAIEKKNHSFQDIGALSKNYITAEEVMVNNNHFYSVFLELSQNEKRGKANEVDY